MTLTPSQIEVLARFDGWKKMQGGYRKMITVFNKALDKEIEVPEDRRDETIWKYFTSPGVLIEMRLKVLKQLQKMEGMYGEEVKFNEEVTDLILSGKYTAAAIKTSEIIQKLEA
jgi:hypothetical protein